MKKLIILLSVIFFILSNIFALLGGVKGIEKNIITAKTIEWVTLAENDRETRSISNQYITDDMKSFSGDIGIPGIAIGIIKVYTGAAIYRDVIGGVNVVETKSYFDLVQQYK